LHDTTPEKVDAQNAVDMLMTAVTDCPEVDGKDRFWQNDTTRHCLQIVHSVREGLPIHTLHCLPISELYSEIGRCLEIYSVNAGP
jgi:hypothetical protein